MEIGSAVIRRLAQPFLHVQQVVQRLNLDPAAVAAQMTRRWQELHRSDASTEDKLAVLDIIQKMHLVPDLIGGWANDLLDEEPASTAGSSRGIADASGRTTSSAGLPPDQARVGIAGETVSVPQLPDVPMEHHIFCPCTSPLRIHARVAGGPLTAASVPRG